MESWRQWPDAEVTPFWVPFRFTLAAGASITQTVAPQIPDGWIVAVVPAAGNVINVVPGPSVAGIGIPIGGGGSCKVVANGAECSFQNVGTNPATIVAIASRGRYLDIMQVSPGNLA